MLRKTAADSLYSIVLLFCLMFLACTEGPVVKEEPDISPSDGMKTIYTQADFQYLAVNANPVGAYNQLEVKFVISDIRGPSPTLYFINSKNYEYHYYFVSEVLKSPLSVYEFTYYNYFTDDRDYLAGSILFFPNYSPDSSASGIFTMGFWPSDPVHLAMVKKAYELISRNLLIKGRTLVYHPRSSLQERFIQEEHFDTSGVPYLLTDELYKQFNYIPYNNGESYGILRISPRSQYTFSDIAFFSTVPPNASHISGIITDYPQTPLSHINILARQNNIPNAYIKDFSSIKDYVSLDNKYVHLVVEDNSFVLEEATESQYLNYLENFRPHDPQVPQSDITEKEIRPLSQIGFANSTSYGAKASNLAELLKIIPEYAPDGFAVPFAYYLEFMNQTGLFDEAQEMIADSFFQAYPDFRALQLQLFRKKIEETPLDSTLEKALEPIENAFSGQSIRCRSSANCEDLEFFSGAGIHSSFTHHAQEGPISKTVKQVWASLWNYEAFQERSFYRVDHFSSAMGVLVHRNFEKEKANGVAVTKNIYDPDLRGFYINVQIGEDLITNPSGTTVPEEIIVAAIGQNRDYTVQYIRYSDQVAPGQKVLSSRHLNELVNAMEKIHNHFISLYGGGSDFAMEIEFKVTAEDNLVIKQARPWSR